MRERSERTLSYIIASYTKFIVWDTSAWKGGVLEGQLLAGKTR
jgi:hypothetical protein